MTQQKCPFKEGDVVVYRPSYEGRGQVIMTKLAALKPGEKYKIARIDRDVYVVLVGFEDASGGGFYWTEFAAEQST